MILIPILVFLFTSIFMYFISNDSKKDKPKNIITRNVFPGMVFGLLVFIIIKYKDSSSFTNEPVMGGNYFD